jgi:hypothetical protein
VGKKGASHILLCFGGFPKSRETNWLEKMKMGRKTPKVSTGGQALFGGLEPLLRVLAGQISSLL